jgi:hypothetical protein
LKKEEPRSGKRKPIEESEDEEDQKKVFTMISLNLTMSFRMRTF